MTLVRPDGDGGWSAEDWQVFFDERAGIAEFDGGLPRPEAEVQAFACCVSEWLNRNPVRSRPAVVSAAVGTTRCMTRCYPSAPKPVTMLGCIITAGTGGTRAGRNWPSPRSPKRASATALMLWAPSGFQNLLNFRPTWPKLAPSPEGESHADLERERRKIRFRTAD